MNTTIQRPAWAGYADELIWRLRHNPNLVAMTDQARESKFDRDLKQPSYRSRKHPSLSIIDLLDGSDDEPDKIISTGLRTRYPVSALSARMISLAIRLAASFGSGRAFAETCLKPSGVTLISGIDTDVSDLVYRLILYIMLPPGISVDSRADILAGEDSGLMVATSDSGSAKARRDFFNDIMASLDHGFPLLILQSDDIELPSRLARILPEPLRLHPLSSEIMLHHLRLTHGAGMDEDAVRKALPDDKALQSLPFEAISAALRASTAEKVAACLALQLTIDERPAGPGLDAIAGNNEAVQTARLMMADLKAWQKGEAEWSEITRSLLLYGPPGTGKSYLARAMGHTPDVGFVQASFATWQGRGHLGDMLAAMQASFAEAKGKKPAILFIDEIDAAGSRTARDDHAVTYRTQVINGFIEQVDLLMQAEGVLLVGACNDPSRLDPAILREGRFDLKCEVPRPDHATILSIMRLHLASHFPEETLETLARRAIGLTAAEVDAAIRRAHSLARMEGRALQEKDLSLNLAETLDPTLDFRSAVHECGHAIVIHALNLGTVERLSIAADGNGSTRHRVRRDEQLLFDIEAELAGSMAGRAAERLIFADISAGGGGGITSDIAIATDRAARIETHFGLGQFGPVWLGSPQAYQEIAETLRLRIRERLIKAESRAEKLLTHNQDLLVWMAEQLVERRELQGAVLTDLLKEVVKR
ncbi:AAA family ATPase [Martelella limonii]|uniref:AAA family ATPase n=1 Tax=Martelella limonii TaxID=1647649 RepID=UPI0015800575|nr:AAA family ATPase [Martelella limonii]